MKVIGKSEAGYLIAATESEIGDMFGVTSIYGDEWKKVREELRRKTYSDSLVGLQINVSAEYARLAWLRRRNEDFKCLVESLRKTADTIEASKPLFEAVVGDKPNAA